MNKPPSNSPTHSSKSSWWFIACCLSIMALVGLVIGCSADSESSVTEVYDTSSAGEQGSSPPEGKPFGTRLQAGQQEAGSNSQDGDGSKTSIAARRKIIYQATLQVVVENFDGVESQINKLTIALGGFIADSRLDRMQGANRQGHWIIRIPVENYDAFLNSASEIGIPESRIQKADDVTEEFFDMEARIKNKKRLEERIVALLEKSIDKIEDVIEVERELGRVREDIERMEGRQRVLKDKISLTTINLTVREEEKYEPPQTATFANRVSRAWEASCRNLITFIQKLIVGIVSAIFPLLLLGFLGTVAIWIGRRKMRQNRE